MTKAATTGPKKRGPLVLINVLAFAVAYALTQNIKGSNLFRTVFFMPNLIGGIVLGHQRLVLACIMLQPEIFFGFKISAPFLKIDLRISLNAYNADQSDANWEGVRTAFVDGWGAQYQAVNG